MNYVDFNFNWLIDRISKLSQDELFEHMKSKYLHLPIEIKESKRVDTYIEPFVGAGAFFIYIASNYEFNKIVINDINYKLMKGLQELLKKTTTQGLYSILFYKSNNK